jgi:microsomal dipeptidase-like Zn-dependent dipeptidase
VPVAPAHELAQTCVSVADLAATRRIGIEGNSRYGVSARAEGAAWFFVRPTALGSFLLYDQDGGLLAQERGRLVRHRQPGTQSEWRIERLELTGPSESSTAPLSSQVLGESAQASVSPQATPNLFLLTSLDGKWRVRLDDRGVDLVASASEAPELGTQLVSLERQASERCQAFPEAALDASVSRPRQLPTDEMAPVRGLVDYHTHIGFPRALAGAAMSGDAFHRYGVAHALGSCAELHGKRGELDLLEGHADRLGFEGHGVGGYPRFDGWPTRRSKSHIQAYYRWIERAHLGGLRLMVTHVTGNPTFCELLRLMHPKKARGQCSSDDVIAQQSAYIRELQDYVDAQSGGPGRGWLRIVTSSSEARRVINHGKLAVVLGSEYGELFDCGERASFCTPEYLDRKIEELYAAGIRSVFPIHRFDNAFGGTMPQGGSNGAWMNLTSKLSTSRVEHLLDLIDPRKLLFRRIGGHFWELEACPDGSGEAQQVRSMQVFIAEDFRFLVDAVRATPVVGGFLARVLERAFVDRLAPLPDYREHAPDTWVCNKRSLQGIGRHLLTRLAQRGMIIEIDHLSRRTLDATLDTLEELGYPGLVSSHGWIDRSPALRQRIFRLGGQVAVSTQKPRDFLRVQQLHAEERRVLGVEPGIGIGSDIQGLATQAVGEDDLLVRYPFQSVDGVAEFYPPKTGERQFDFDREGMAHYGLLPEWLEELYLRMWERAEARAEALRAADAH